MTYNGTSAPVRRVVFEPERQDNPFTPALPAPSPERWIPAPEFTTPERERETVGAPSRKGARSC